MTRKQQRRKLADEVAIAWCEFEAHIDRNVAAGAAPPDARQRMQPFEEWIGSAILRRLGYRKHGQWVRDPACHPALDAHYVNTPQFRQLVQNKLPQWREAVQALERETA